MPPETITYLQRLFPGVVFDVQFPGAPAPNPNITSQRQRRVATVKVKDKESRSWRVTLDAPRLEVRNTPSGPLIPADMLWSPAASGRDYDTLRAIVRWGDQAGTHEAVIDWHQGSSFSVHGHYVEVDASIPINATTDVFAVGSQTRKLYVAANIVPDEGNEEIKYPTFTTRTGIIVSQDFSVPIPIPHYARRVRWYTVFNTSAPVGIYTPPVPILLAQVMDAAGTMTCAADVFSSSASTPASVGAGEPVRGWPADQGGWPIEASARYLFVGNGGGEDPVFNLELALEFDLDIG